MSDSICFDLYVTMSESPRLPIFDEVTGLVIPSEQLPTLAQIAGEILEQRAEVALPQEQRAGHICPPSSPQPEEQVEEQQEIEEIQRVEQPQVLIPLIPVAPPVPPIVIQPALIPVVHPPHPPPTARIVGESLYALSDTYPPGNLSTSYQVRVVGTVDVEVWGVGIVRINISIVFLLHL